VTRPWARRGFRSAAVHPVSGIRVSKPAVFAGRSEMRVPQGCGCERVTSNDGDAPCPPGAGLPAAKSCTAALGHGVPASNYGSGSQPFGPRKRSTPSKPDADGGRDGRAWRPSEAKHACLRGSFGFAPNALAARTGRGVRVHCNLNEVGDREPWVRQRLKRAPATKLALDNKYLEPDKKRLCIDACLLPQRHLNV
jgi:hypothetical protein